MGRTPITKPLAINHLRIIMLATDRTPMIPTSKEIRSLSITQLSDHARAGDTR